MPQFSYNDKIIRWYAELTANSFFFESSSGIQMNWCLWPMIEQSNEQTNENGKKTHKKMKNKGQHTRHIHHSPFTIHSIQEQKFNLKFIIGEV